MSDSVSRYVSAIVSIAKEENKLTQYKVAVFDLANKLQSEPKLLKILTSYFVKDEEKFSLIDELCSSYSLSNLNNFMKLLAKNHKILTFKDIAKEINKEINNELNIYEGTVYSTSDIDDEKIASIEEVISKKVNHKVELTNKLDPRLIGGIKVVVHDHVFDGSIKYQLENMKQNLKERRATNEN